MTALLVMDVQRVVVDRYPHPTYLSTLQTAIANARATEVPVIYVVIGFRPGFPEVSPRNKIFGALAAHGLSLGTAEATEVHPSVAPQAGDIVVTKRRVSAFAGSDLDTVLRANSINDVVLTGIATSGVVLPTLRQAADLDFGLTVLSDACLDDDPDVHRVLMEKVFPSQAEVTTVADWAASM